MTDRLLTGVLAASLLAAAAGCAHSGAAPMHSAGTAPTDSGRGAALPRPGRVVVYDFTVVSTEEAALAGDPAGAGDPAAAMDMRLDAENPPAAAGPIARSVAAALSDELVTRIRAMGLPAERARGAAPVAGAVPLPAASLAVEGQLRAVEAAGRPRQTDGRTGADVTRVATDVQAYLVRGDAPELVWEFAGGADGRVLSGTGPGGAGAGAADTGGGAETAGESSQRADAYARRIADGIAQRLGEFFAAHGWTAGR